MIKYKEGVKIGGIKPQLLAGLQVAEGAYSKYELDCTVTSVCDYRHTVIYSEHYQGNAADLRMKNISTFYMKNSIFEEIRTNLPMGFVLLWENKNETNEHFHLAWRPKYEER